MNAYLINRNTTLSFRRITEKMGKFFFHVSITIFITSCSNIGEEPDGGPCTYDKKIYPATVIGIIKKDSLVADIIFRVNDLNGNIYRDSILWSMEKKELMPLAMIEKDSIAVGKKYTYDIWKILTGHCNPKIETLKIVECKLLNSQ